MHFIDLSQISCLSRHRYWICTHLHVTQDADHDTGPIEAYAVCMSVAF